MIKTIPYIFIEIHRIHRKIWVCNWKMRRPDCPCCHLLGCVFHGWPAFQRSRSSNLRNLESSWCAWQCQPQLGSIAESRYYPATQSRFLKMFLKSNEKQLTVLSVPNLNSWRFNFYYGGHSTPHSTIEKSSRSLDQPWFLLSCRSIEPSFLVQLCCQLDVPWHWPNFRSKHSGHVTC